MQRLFDRTWTFSGAWCHAPGWAGDEDTGETNDLDVAKTSLQWVREQNPDILWRMIIIESQVTQHVVLDYVDL